MQLGINFPDFPFSNQELSQEISQSMDLTQKGVNSQQLGLHAQHLGKETRITCLEV